MQYLNTHPHITFKLDLRDAPDDFWFNLGNVCGIASNFKHSGISYFQDDVSALASAQIEGTS